MLAQDTVPEQIGRYRVTGKLGQGGMGVVYLAYDAKLQRSVAIKLLTGLSDDAGRERLLREARAASALNHPNICTIYEVDEAGDQAFIVMEHIEGKPLSDLIRSEGLPSDTALCYGLQITEALAHAHDRCVVHRDIKASNILMTPQGRAKVLDFGLAKRVSGKELTEDTTRSRASLTEAGVLAGTLPYIAPEQLRGEDASACSDIWALGVVLYEMIAGQLPFQRKYGIHLELGDSPGIASSTIDAGSCRLAESDPALSRKGTRRAISACQRSPRGTGSPAAGTPAHDRVHCEPTYSGQGETDAHPFIGRATASESLSQSGRGVFRRRNDRRPDHDPGADRRVARDLAYVRDAVQRCTQAAA